MQKLAPYFPTPETIVDKMLKLGELKAGETVFDLGSGDGRIVIDAARKYKANAIGVELDDRLYLSRAWTRIKSLGLSTTARIIHGDLLKQDYSSADLLTVYLLPVATQMVTPILEKQLKKGARIVAHDFQFASWRPEQTVDIETTAKAGRTNCTSTAAEHDSLSGAVEPSDCPHRRSRPACLGWYGLTAGLHVNWLTALLAAYAVYSLGALAEVRYDTAMRSPIGVLADTLVLRVVELGGARGVDAGDRRRLSTCFGVPAAGSMPELLWWPGSRWCWPLVVPSPASAP